jgi:flagellar biosynthetic protein FliQ
MEPGVALDISREALMHIIVLSAPLLGIALIVGVVISLFQAVTQIQEMTLTFVPKIFAMAIAMIIFLPFMLNKIMLYAERMFGPMPLP